MPSAIYQYVYYEPLNVGGPETRQNRNPATSSKYLPVPGILVPSTNVLATGSTFTPDVPPASYSHAGLTYNFGFMNVSGCVGAGETSTDITHLPGTAPLAPLVVGDQVINILVVYIVHGGGGGGGGAGIYLDAFNETTGAFLDNFFVTSIAPDNSLTSNVNVYGSLAVEPHVETLVAAAHPINTPMVVNSSAVFDKWVKLEGPAGNPVISGNSLSLGVGASTPSDIAAFAFYKDPASVYITGGYESPDILLFTPFSTSALGTLVPIGSWDTSVLPGVHYGFAAVVHNDSAYEVSTKVTFWNIPGGAGTLGVMLDTQTVIIPASSSATVFSSLPFINTGGHTCAVVSIDTDDSPCQFDPASSADSIHIPSPLPVGHNCSAWRNTNTIFVLPGAPWHFEIGLGDIHHYGEAQIGIQFEVQHAAADFARNEKDFEVIKAHRRIYAKTPPYLIPVLRKKLPSADIKPVVTLVSKGEIQDRQGEGYLLTFADKAETGFKVSGVVPANAKAGDTFLVQLTAHYPKTGRVPARSVGFLQILVVKDNLRVKGK
ncbi:hypothetical protein [Mucilaginibacter sp. OK098]|uniref:hypothetical protein n=1 Tax=Mucilaginibacter sp. OK098 TaxID=1855297 RepID=UPI00091DDD2B|nr:hypothetical protein [Mucilaginibacter sp. OK098]SHN33294.1 hypothetical protein SAMN05216524_11073 [Mucilaginibacter sp. OK098]